MKILLVEDNKKVASFIQRGLTSEGYFVEIAYDGKEGYEQVLDEHYDLVILDWMLPFMNGLELLQKIREHHIQVPVLLLTAKDAVDDRVQGLDQGADDYLTKPFAFPELMARIRALSRREIKSSTNNVLKIADLSLDLQTRKVTRGSQLIDLTAKEYGLLEYFLRYQEKVVTRAMIADHVWGQDFDGFTNVIDVYVRHLRKKLDEGFSSTLLHTMRGVGYILSEKQK